MEDLSNILEAPQEFEVKSFKAYKDGNGEGTAKFQAVKPDIVIGDMEFNGGQITLYAKGVKGINAGDKVTIDPEAFVFKVVDFEIDDNNTAKLKWIYPKL